MSKDICISVVMSEYNTDTDDLRESIKSILSQSYNNFEFIIVDDCGNNDLGMIVEEFNDSRIRVVRNSKNMGLVYSLNSAIRHASGEYLVRMDTDDTVTNDRIKILYDFIKKHPEYDVVSSRAVEFSGDKEFGTVGKPGEKTKHNIMRGDVPIHAAAIMRKKAIQEVGGYKNYTRAEDLALWCELLLKGKRLYMLNDVLYRYRVNPADYKKRTIKNRRGEIQARLFYYPRLGAKLGDYLVIVKSIVAGIIPGKLVQAYRNTFVLNKKQKTIRE